MIIIVGSDISRILYEEHTTPDAILDRLQEWAGDGTLLIPTYNYDFCNGVPFDPASSRCQVGALGNAALRRGDFRRTRHPIYSFAAWGKHQEMLCNLPGVDSFGIDSPFAYANKMLLIDVSLQHSLTWAHFVEQLFRASSRYLKTFRAGDREATMYVRDLESGVQAKLNDIEYFSDTEMLAPPWGECIDLDNTLGVLKNAVLGPDYGRIYTTKHDDMEALFDRLWPIMRSITGAGIYETLTILEEHVMLDFIRIPTGTKVWDWKIPPEWDYRGATLKDSEGREILNADKNTLHLVNYSEPHHGTLLLSELQSHLHSIPEKPHTIPYVTSYYNREWGFCLPDELRRRLPDGRYRVDIDTEFYDGNLVLGEATIPGGPGEIWFSTYICHPSMANNELSGPIALTELYKRLVGREMRYTYKFLFLPETIGSLAYLHHRKDELEMCRGGYVVTCCGDNANLCYKRSPATSEYESENPDAIAEFALEELGGGEVYDYYPHEGSDERQYCSPGFDLPIGTVMRSRPGHYEEYHISDDSKAIISWKNLNETVRFLERIVMLWEQNWMPEPTVEMGEPFFSKYDLYQWPELMPAYRWLLNAGGRKDIISISRVSGIPFDTLIEAGVVLLKKGLLK